MVVVIVLCPKIFDTLTMSTPARTRRLAPVCLSVCHVAVPWSEIAVLPSKRLKSRYRFRCVQGDPTSEGKDQILALPDPAQPETVLRLL